MISTAFRICSVFLATVCATALAGEQTAPNTVAGKVLTGFMEVLNGGDEARLRDFRMKYGWPGTVEDDLGFREMTGGIDLVDVLKSEPLLIHFVVKARSNEVVGVGKIRLTNLDRPQVAEFGIGAVPPGASIIGFSIDDTIRTRVIAEAIAKLREVYVFPGTAKKMEQALLRHQKRRDYDAIVDGDDFARLLTAHLQEVSKDKHLTVAFSPTRLPPNLDGSEPSQRAEQLKDLQRMNCGFEKVEILADNVGYAKFNMFADPGACGETAIAVMNFLAHADAVIFDLRDNGGGDPKMIALISSYLFEKPTHLNDIWERKGESTQQYWTLPFVPGKRFPNVPVYVLTSARTFSGAEEFSYNLKTLKRATIVGESTGGGAHPTAGYRIDDRFSIGVPYARAINPLTKTNWEGAGVAPDVNAAAPDALSVAQKLAMDALGKAKESEDLVTR